MQTTQRALLLLRYKAGRRNGCALKIATFSPKDITPPEGQRPLALPPPHRRWDVAGYPRRAPDGASANPKGNLGAGVRTPRKPTWQESLRGRRSAEDPAWERRNRLDSTKPARPPRPSRPRSSASRRRKCCVAHFRVLSGRRRRASVVSRPPPPPPPWVLEPGATSPPWPASKVGLRRWTLQGWVVWGEGDPANAAHARRRLSPGARRGVPAPEADPRPSNLPPPSQRRWARRPL